MKQDIGSESAAEHLLKSLLKRSLCIV